MTQVKKNKNLQLLNLLNYFFCTMLVSLVPQQFTKVSLTQRPLGNVKTSGPVCAENRLFIFALSLEKFLEQK